LGSRQKCRYKVAIFHGCSVAIALLASMMHFSCMMAAVVLGSVCLCPAFKLKDHALFAHHQRTNKSEDTLTEPSCWQCGNEECKADTNVCLPETPVKTHWLVGDSHAKKMIGAWKFAASPEAQLHNIFGCACRGGFEGLDEAFHNRLITRLGTVLKQGDTVIVNEWMNDQQVTAGCWAKAHFKERLQGLHYLTGSKGANLVVVADNTDFTGTMAEKLTKQQVLRNQASFRAAMQEVFQGSTHAFVFDMLDYVCEADTCSRYFPGTRIPLLADTDHIDRPDLVQVQLKAFMKQHGLL